MVDQLREEVARPEDLPTGEEGIPEELLEDVEQRLVSVAGLDHPPAEVHEGGGKLEEERAGAVPTHGVPPRCGEAPAVCGEAEDGVEEELESEDGKVAEAQRGVVDEEAGGPGAGGEVGGAGGGEGPGPCAGVEEGAVRAQRDHHESGGGRERGEGVWWEGV